MLHRTRLFVVFSLLPACTSLERLIADTQIPDPNPRELHPARGADFDHGALTEVLEQIVDPEGRVDYRALARGPGKLDLYLEQLEGLDYDALSRDAKLACLINAYNAFTLRLILDHWPLESIKDIPKADRWEKSRWSLGGEVVSLNEIEHERLRAEFREPRIHFAINCASESCPPLSRAAYQAETLDAQLGEAARRVHDPGSRWFSWSEEDRSVGLLRIYLWFHKDFEAAAGSVEAYAARYSPQLREAMASGGVKVNYLDYDWSLNATGEAP